MSFRKNGASFLLSVAIVISTLSLAGCREEDVAVQLRFPNETTFLFSETIRLVVTEVDGEDRNACADVLNNLQTGAVEGAYFASGPLDACAFQSGEVVVDSIPDGTQAYAVVALERDSATVLLSGCAVKDVRVQERVVPIDLRTSSHYDNTYPALPPGCTLEQRCQESCTPGTP